VARLVARVCSTRLRRARGYAAEVAARWAVPLRALPGSGEIGVGAIGGGSSVIAERPPSARLLAVEQRRIDPSMGLFGLVDLNDDTVERASGEVDDHDV
jgi:hypothetical protein